VLQAAQQLDGHPAGEVVGRSAAHVLPPPEDARRIAAFTERCRARGGWSGTVAVRHRDGHTLTMAVRMCC
jgi:PAS domain-containing protein